MGIEESKDLQKIFEKILKVKEIESCFEIIDINNGKPFTFNEDDYNVKEGKPKYSNSNNLKKSGSATAIISKNTISIYSSENIEYPDPINWEKLQFQRKKLSNGKMVNIFQKCHIIGYHLSAKFSNPNNIFIGTDNLNHGGMKQIEDEICAEALKNKKILYKVTPVYMFKNDIIPIGVLFEYEIISNKNKRAYCKFCFNIERGYKINYYDGSDTKIENIELRKNDKIKEVFESSNVSNANNKYKNYYIDIENKKIHLVMENKCTELNNTKMKYIQEVTGNIIEMLETINKDLDENQKFKICKSCIREESLNN